MSGYVLNMLKYHIHNLHETLSNKRSKLVWLKHRKIILKSTNLLTKTATNLIVRPDWVMGG